MVHGIISFIFSFILCFILILLKKFNIKLGIDLNSSGPQKHHETPTLRLGGIAIFIAVLLSVLLLFKKEILYFIISSAPIVLSGIAEDLTGRVSVKIRFLASIISAIFGIILFHALITRVNLPLIDNVISISFISFFVTIIAVAGVTNSFNIIDGYNGLISIVSVIIFSGFAYIAFKVNDFEIIYISIFMIGAILGFFLWNYPYGKIFMGDGGAYFIGFIVAEISIILTNKHSQVSAWFPLLLCIYPIFETIFSIYRRKFIKKTHPFLPDSLHLHQLIYKRIVPYLFNSNIKNSLLCRNSATSPFLWFLTLLSFIPSIVFWNNTVLLIIFTLFFTIIYVILYKSIVKFKAQKFFKFFKE